MFASVKYAERAPQQRLATVARQAGLMTYPLFLNHFVLGQAILLYFVGSLPDPLVMPAMLIFLIGLAWFISWGPERYLQDRAIAGVARALGAIRSFPAGRARSSAP